MSETMTTQELWGAETSKAVVNFPVSGEPIPVSVARWLGRIKAAAARANAELGLLDADKAQRIAAAGDRIANGELDDQFPIDVFQTGSGTSSNMNANEVIAALAGEGVHANDDVNMGQSSNDVFPSAVHLAALGEITNDLLPALEQLTKALAAKAAEFDDVVKSGRTHWMDAVPVTLGQEFAGYAAQVSEGKARVESTLQRLGKIPLGGTAVGTGLNTHPEFAERVRAQLSRDTGLEISAPADPFESQAARDGLVEASGALKTVAVSLTKIANDLRFLGSGPRAGLSEIFLPELQKGSSIMPGKVNPVIPEVVTQVAAQVIGNDTAVAIGGMQGHFELNAFVPLIARNLLDQIKLLSSASRLFA
ncbi:MAG TPA: class II fumarate hydratase, partial [Gaiellaceae bacterium]|nr:class II fumarate hydratase [Gaiellaceae bacterium]